MLEIEAVNVNQALTRMGAAKNRLNIMILDSCRNNPFPAFSRAATRGLAVTQAPVGTYIAYATRPGDVAADGSDEPRRITAGEEHVPTSISSDGSMVIFAQRGPPSSDIGVVSLSSESEPELLLACCHGTACP